MALVALAFAAEAYTLLTSVCEEPCYALSSVFAVKGLTTGPGSDLHWPGAEVSSSGNEKQKVVPGSTLPVQE